jgi:hypothetical protein
LAVLLTLSTLVRLSHTLLLAHNFRVATKMRYGLGAEDARAPPR